MCRPHCKKSYTAETALSAVELFNGFVQVLRLEIRPENIKIFKFGVGALPQKEV